MCGIAGVVDPSASPDGGALERMAGAMLDRGPDGQGVWWDEEAGFGFRRLAIIDLEERSNQPLHLGGLHLVFNGEIYNYIELREELEGLGHRFSTEGDGEVLLHAWAQWGERALEHFEGMFALAIWDDRHRRLTLAVDPFAEKPLYYCQREGRLLFASSIRALKAAEPEVGVADERAIEEFVALGTIPSLPRTFFADVSRVPPACVANWEGGKLSSRRYWTPRWVSVPDDPPAAATRLRELLLDTIRLRLRSDVAVGTSLSGGVDSSAIVSACAHLAGGHVRHAFTATFPGFPRDEWTEAHAVSQAAGVVRHHAVAPRAEELLDDLPALVRDQEEPFISTSVYAQWRVMRAAREAGVVVLLDGQGADELFGGYLGTGSWALRAAGPRAALAALAMNPAIAKDLAIAYTAGRLPRAVARQYRLRRASRYVTDAVARSAAQGELAREEWEGSPLRRELLSQAFRLSLPNLCRYADRDSMAHSVEVRMPFLDRRVAEFAFSLPTSMIFCDGVTKRTLRDSLRGLVPDPILDSRVKVGYETPQERWFNTPVARSRLAEIVLDRNARASGRYDTAALERDLAAGAWGDVNALWRAVNVELWLASMARPVNATMQAA